LHLGIALFMGLGLFGLIMILLTISAFGYEAWIDLKDPIKRVSVRSQRA